MSTAGEASSLFGAAESTNDPFALPAQGESDVSGNDPFANIQPTSEADDIFSNVAYESTPSVATQDYPTVYPATERDSGWNGSNSHHYAPKSSQDPYSHTQQNAYSAQAVTNGWQSTQGQWSAGDTQQQYGTVNGTYSSHSYPQNMQTNDPYASYASNAYAPPAVSTPATRPASYGTYAPATNSSNAYTPAPAPSTYEPTYDPYKPSQVPAAKPVAPIYAQPTNGSPLPPLPPVEAPARTAASAAPYRPKTSNAYDPPIPPPKAAPRRPAAWQSPLTSPAQLGYPSSIPGSPPIRSPLPPPPRKASVPPPPPRSGSAALRDRASPAPPLPHAQAFGASGPLPSSAMSPPPRAGSAARQFATPPPPQSTFYSPPPSTVYQSPPASYRSPPQSSAYQPHQPTHETVASPGVYPPLEESHPTKQSAETAQPVDPLAEEAISHASDTFWNDLPNDESTQRTNALALDAPHNDSYDTHASTTEVSHNEHQEQHDALDVSEVEQAQTYVAASSPEVPHDHYDPEGAFVGEEQHVDDDRVTSRPPERVAQGIAQPPATYEAQTSAPVYDPYRPTATFNHPAQPLTNDPPNHAYSPEMSTSSWATSPRQSLDESRPSAVSPSIPPPPPSRSSTDSYSAPAYSYAPSVTQVPRTASPSSLSVRSNTSVRDPYAPSEPTAAASTARYRSMSNGSAFSTSGVQEDPYAPSRHSRQQSTESYTYKRSLTSTTLEEEGSLVTPTASASAQVVTLAAPARTLYAPSPSLIGSNDPLGRTSVRVPVFNFGFGGKVVTCFHGSDMLHTGFDVAMSSRASTTLHIRSLHSIVPQSAMETSSAVYPGPLFSDPGAPTTTLVRPGAVAHAKTKKTQVIKYLEERAEEISQGLGYMHQGSVDLYRSEAKRVLVNLLKVMVENDGRLSGSPQIDTAVRAALLPGGEATSDISADKLAAQPISTSRSGFDLTASSYSALAPASYDPDNVKLADHPLWSSQLDKIEGFLARGDRHGAYHYAADEKLWAHAMIIASSIDKESWKEVVTEFVRSELSSAGVSSGKSTMADNRAPLRVAYSLFAGQGAGCVQELHPPKPLGALAHSLSAVPATFGITTPMSAGFPQSTQPVALPKETLMKWPATAAMIIGSPLTTESSAALTALGDHLAFNKWFEAAHVCYLLSPQTSPVGGIASPGVRVVLYGSPSPQAVPSSIKDPDAVIFSEIVEFALSLSPPAKGQEAFGGLSHLQSYRLYRATCLAELGHMNLANRYCEAISHSIGRGSPYLNTTFMAQLQDLTDRLVAAPLMDKSGSWIGSKMARPSLDKIGNWLEGRLTSFIAGEGDSPNPAETNGKAPTFGGPFAHYSSISSATPSAMPSPQMSYSNLPDTQTPAPPFRTGSAMALRTSTTSPAQIARASSAIDYLRRKPSPVNHVSSAGASTASGLPSKLQVPYGYAGGYPGLPTTDLSTPTAQEDSSERPAGPQIASWWGESESATPTATSFPHPEQEPSSEGFISLMDAPGASDSSSSTNAQFTAAARMQTMSRDDIDEEDDLGLGNSSARTKATVDAPAEPVKKAAAPPAAPEKSKEPEKPAASSGWLSRIWKRSESGPVKANLGDENTFYYDAETKRWVNKNAPPEPPKATPPPPPRAQTASPGMSAARGPPPQSPGPPPPVRPATAIDLTDGPPKKPPMRIRSNLVPPEASSAPTTPGSAGPPRTPNTMMDGPPGLDAPPTPGARRAPPKRNARSRYVDVFQQEPST